MNFSAACFFVRAQKNARACFLVGERLHGLVFYGGRTGLFFFGVQSPISAALNNRQPFRFVFFAGGRCTNVARRVGEKFENFSKEFIYCDFAHTAPCSFVYFYQ